MRELEQLQCMVGKRYMYESALKGFFLLQKLFDIKMAEFKFHLLCWWSQSGQFEVLNESQSRTIIADLKQ